MPHADIDGVKLHYLDVAGASAGATAAPIVFVHEFAGDAHSWEAQIRFFSRTRRCVAYNARGYPPSDAPADPASYSQETAADDAVRVMDRLGIERAHLVGLSMGGFAVLHAGLRHPDRARSLVVAGCGYGAERATRAEFHETVEAMARGFETGGTGAVADDYARSATRIQFRNKDPRGWAEFRDRLRGHSAVGSAATLRGYLKTRPSLYDLEDLARGAHRAHAHRQWRRGRTLSRRRPVPQADDPGRRALGAAAHRPHHQPRGAGALQPRRRRFHRRRGGRRLGPARPPFARPGDARPRRAGTRVRLTRIARAVKARVSSCGSASPCG